MGHAQLHAERTDPPELDSRTSEARRHSRVERGAAAEHEIRRLALVEDPPGSKGRGVTMLMTPEIKVLYEERKNKFLGLEVAEVKKVVLTVEQDKALKAALAKESADAILKSAAREHETWFNECQALNYMDLPTIAKALYAGYEVEQPQFKAGDKVTVWGRVVTLKKNREILGSEAWTIEENNGVNFYTSDLIIATPEEIYWMETLGREKVMDFLPGDVFIDAKADVHELFTANSPKAKKWYRQGNFIGLHPAEHFKPFPKEEQQ